MAVGASAWPPPHQETTAAAHAGKGMAATLATAHASTQNHALYVPCGMHGMAAIAIHTHHQFTAARRRRYERMKPRSAAWGHGEIRVRCPIIPGALTHPPRPAFAGKKPPPSGPSRHDRRPARALFPPVPDRVERKKKNKLVVWRAPHARARPP